MNEWWWTSGGDSKIYQTAASDWSVVGLSEIIRHSNAEKGRKQTLAPVNFSCLS